MRWLFSSLFMGLAACGFETTNPAEVPDNMPPSTHFQRLAQMIDHGAGRVSTVDGGRLTTGPNNGMASGNRNWRLALNDVYLSEKGPQTSDGAFYFSSVEARETRIRFNSLINRPVRVVVRCDGQARLFGADGVGRILRKGRVRAFELPARSHGQAYLRLGPEVNACNLRWGEDGQQQAQMRLLNETVARPDIARIDRRADYCASPDPARLDALEAVFYADRWLSQTCTRPVARVDMLPGPLAALNARIEALTGTRASEAALLAGDPNMALDFSRAPDLRMIYVSYLLVRADFSGALLGRMLAWHAARGTIVRIIFTDILMLDQDRAFFEGLAAKYPNIQLQYFNWSTSGLQTPGDVLDRSHRVHHIKVFATLARTPGRSRVIIGGRNFWDGYFFDTPFDLDRYPQLRTYEANETRGLLYHSVYEDFEVQIHGDAFAADMVAQMARFWLRDGRTQVMRPLAVGLAPKGGAPKGGVQRHFISQPWADGRALEVYYAELFDAAEREIVLVSPYIYPTAPILRALLRAHARGVRVVVVTRAVSTDPPGQVISVLNSIFMRRWNEQFAFYQYALEGREMHTKMILIDERLAVVGSVNMNQRSFLHDGENGVVFLDRAVVRRLRGEIDTYLATASRYTPPTRPELPPLERLVGNLRALWEYF